LDIPYAQVDKIVNLIPDNFYITLKEAYRENQKIKKELQCNPKLKTLWNYGIKLEGLKTSIGTSLTGVIINNKPLWKKVPLYKLSRQEIFAIQYTTQNIQDVGLTVFNFLGLKDLTIINKINELIEKKRGKKINFYEIDLNDSKVYKLISSGDTFGIFQLKSSFMQDILTRVKPTKFEDLSAILALSFPKPIENGTLNDFIDKKQNKVKINYFFDEFEQPLKPILGLTYGVIVYQEQIMKILQIIGGFNLDKADLARQAMSKQNKKQIDNFKDEFSKGGLKKGYSKKYCDKLFDSITKSAEFVNLKSHSISYAMISYQMAYLKTYYPNEFRSGIVINANEKY
jgi:DNA polymerase-3 subunit alpha